MMFGVDQDGDGEVDYHEFIEMMTDKPKPTKKWNKKEKQTKIPEHRSSMLAAAKGAEKLPRFKFKWSML